MPATPVDADGTRRLRRSVRALRVELATVAGRLERARPADLHRVRVLARRLRALIGAYAPCFDPAGARRARRALEQVARSADACREADVRAALLTGLAPTNGSSSTAGSRSTDERLRAMLARERGRHARALVAGFADDDARRELRVAMASLRVIDEIPTAVLVERLRRARRRLRHRAAAHDGRRAAHRLRLAVKRLRYSIAPVEDLAPDESHRLLVLLREAQEHLGERHDALLAIDWVRAHRAALGRGLASQLVDRLEDRAREARRAGRAAIARVGPGWKAWRRATRDLRAAPSGRRGPASRGRGRPRRRA